MPWPSKEVGKVFTIPVLIDGAKLAVLRPKYALLTAKSAIVLDDPTKCQEIVRLIRPELLGEMLRRHVENLDVFLDPSTGAVRDEGRCEVGRDEPPFLYTEVTGYAIQDLVDIYSLTHNPELLDRAIRAAQWIAKQATHESGGVLTRFYFDKDQQTDLDEKLLFRPDFHL